MDAHQIGQQLRAQVLRDHAQGRPLDSRRLQALVADLCGDEQQALIAPLRHLLLSAAFSSAAGAEPPLTDGRHRQRLHDELSELFAPAVCERLQPLLDGLVGWSADTKPATGGGWATASVAPQMAYAAEASAPPAAPQGPRTAPAAPGGQASRMPAPPARAAGSPVNALLAFLSGVLLMALAGLGLLAWQRQSALAPQPPGIPNTDPTTSTAATPPPAILPAPSDSRTEAGRDNGTAALPPPPALPPAGSSEPPGEPAATATRTEQDRAVASLQQLYGALSAKDFNQARMLFAGAAADQFSPGFFRQFERVSVQDLRLTSQTGSTLNLEGEVTFVWPDGSVQRESRSFSVDTGSDPARITASEFGRVITPRR